MLDNCEHLLAASAQAAGHLLRECPGVRVLATSREALAITGETVWGVPGLAVPPPDYSVAPPDHAPAAPADPGGAMDYGSVRLFVERAQAVQKDFLLAGNARAVAEVCARLDGIPLAIELAAARVRVLTAEQIASRLDDHLGLLAGGGREVPARQQALRATLDWSYALLGVQEQLLLGRLSVFAGGLDPGGGRGGVFGKGHRGGAGPGPADVPGGQVPGRVRGARNGRALPPAGDDAPVRRRAAGGTRRDGARPCRPPGPLPGPGGGADPLLTGPGQGALMARLGAERENLRAALAWCEAEPGGAEAELRLAGALWQFWSLRGEYSEGRRHLARALARGGGPTEARARALHAAAVLAYGQADLAAAQPLYRESLDIHRESGGPEGHGGGGRRTGQRGPRPR